jgi:hypothetical protein
MFVVFLDVAADLPRQIRNRREDAAGEQVPLDSVEPVGDLIRPRGVAIHGGRNRGEGCAVGQHQNDTRAPPETSRPSFQFRAFIGRHTQHHMALEHTTIDSA